MISRKFVLLLTLTLLVGCDSCAGRGSGLHLYWHQDVRHSLETTAPIAVGASAELWCEYDGEPRMLEARVVDASILTVSGEPVRGTPLISVGPSARNTFTIAARAEGRTTLEIYEGTKRVETLPISARQPARVRWNLEEGLQDRRVGDELLLKVDERVTVSLTLQDDKGSDLAGCPSPDLGWENKGIADIGAAGHCIIPGPPLGDHQVRIQARAVGRTSLIVRAGGVQTTIPIVVR